MPLLVIQNSLRIGLASTEAIVIISLGHSSRSHHSCRPRASRWFLKHWRLFSTIVSFRLLSISIGSGDCIGISARFQSLLTSWFSQVLAWIKSIKLGITTTTMLLWACSLFTSCILVGSLNERAVVLYHIPPTLVLWYCLQRAHTQLLLGSGRNRSSVFGDCTSNIGCLIRGPSGHRWLVLLRSIPIDGSHLDNVATACSFDFISWV